MAANNNPPSALEKEQIFGMAEKEMEYRVELFNNTEQVYGAKRLVVAMVDESAQDTNWNYSDVVEDLVCRSVFEKSLGIDYEFPFLMKYFLRYKESELNMGENSCIDRCVSKYWHVTNLIGQLLGSGRPPM